MRRSKIFFAILGFSFVFAGLLTFAEEKPSVAAVHPPKMPTVQALKTPSFGSGFYAPKIDDFYTGAIIRNSPKNQNVPNAAETEPSSPELDLTETLYEIKDASKNINTILSAQDLAFLDITGDLSTVSNLLASKKANNTSTDALNSGNISAAANSNLLNQILTELQNLKTEKKTPETEKKVALENPAPREKDRTKILRFSVNGYDLLSTCKTIYFSDKESDGTFLLTGDRVYNSNNQSRTETFYMLFKAVGNDGGVTTYKVAPDVTQDYENKYSFLYQLSNKENLVAEKTGNLITMKVKEPAWNMDLLIDAGVD